MPVKAVGPKMERATQLKNVAVSEAPMLEHVQRVMESAAQVSVHIFIRLHFPIVQIYIFLKHSLAEAETIDESDQALLL